MFESVSPTQQTLQTGKVVDYAFAKTILRGMKTNKNREQQSLKIGIVTTKIYAGSSRDKTRVLLALFLRLFRNDDPKVQLCPHPPNRF